MTKAEDAVLRSLDELHAAEEAVRVARLRFYRAVREAHEEGLSYTDLGKLLGVSRQRAAILVRLAD